MGNGHTKIVTLLLQNKADVNQAEQRGHTPLWISALRGHVEVVRVLLSHPSIDIDYKDLSGVTALWAACQNNNSKWLSCCFIHAMLWWKRPLITALDISAWCRSQIRNNCLTLIRLPCWMMMRTA